MIRFDSFNTKSNHFFMKTFQDILRSFREGSVTEREKGGKFEKLMKGYLLSSPIYANTLKTVMWNEFPYRSQFGGSDLGIDLVARTFEGDYWAIQCKCYLETSEIDKAAVDSFLSTSGKTFVSDEGAVKFAHKSSITTCLTIRRLTHNARKQDTI